MKVFLTATAEERARRRYRELQERGTPQPYEQVLREMNEYVKLRCTSDFCHIRL